MISARFSSTLPVALGSGTGHERAGRVEREQSVGDIEHVERALGRKLPVGRARLPAIFAAQDALGFVGDLLEAVAGASAGHRRKSIVSCWL